MRIKSYKDLVGLSIAQARAAYESTIAKNEVLIGTIVDVAAQRDAAQAEVDRLTMVIASYDSPEVETAKSFIKAFNIDVKKYEADAARLVESPSTDSLQKVWKAINGTRRGRPAEISKWTRRRLAQLTRLEELGHAFKAPSGSWWARDPGPQENDR